MAVVVRCLLARNIIAVSLKTGSFAILLNMKNIQKLSVRIILAVLVGFVFAASRTTMTYDCPLIDGAKGCTAFEDAITHPSDLLNNRQNSLVRFSRTFAISSLVTFAVVSAVSIATKDKPKQKGRGARRENSKSNKKEQ